MTKLHQSQKLPKAIIIHGKDINLNLDYWYSCRYYVFAKGITDRKNVIA